MKKILALMLALVMVFALAACGEAETEETTPATEPAGEETTPAEETAPAEETDLSELSLDELLAELETVTEGTLTVATSPDFAPYEFYAIDENGEPVLAGFDLALARYIADYLGLECEIVPMDFDGVLNEIAMKTVDMGMAGLSPDPAREGAMAFSDLYYLGGQSFVSVKDKADQFTSLEDLANHPEYQIGAQNGSIQADLANEYAAPESVVILTKVTDIVAELVNGGLDGAFIETAVAANYAVSNPDLEIIFDVPYDQAGSSIGVQLGNPVLLECVNRAIAAAIDDGSMDTFVAEANELSTGETYEGLLDENGSVPEVGTAAGDAATA